MWYLYRFIIVSGLLFSSSAYALEVFFDPLYWQATETIDWELSNNLSTSNQDITYKTFTFNFKPGYRVGVGYEGDWDMKLYYTKYFTKTFASDSGNLTSAFMGGKLAQINVIDPSLNFFYRTGQANLAIDFNMIDWELGKHFCVTDLLMLRPLIGIEGGWINQTINSYFQGQVSVSENIKNNFSGIGPKIGIESKLQFLRCRDYKFNLIANFATSYLWGHWNIKDVLHNSLPSTMVISVADRNLGALALQGLVGVTMDYKCFSMKLGYEISDWFNQCQIYDDATGAHNNDLILQGVTLGLIFNF